MAGWRGCFTTHLPGFGHAHASSIQQRSLEKPLSWFVQINALPWLWIINKNADVPGCLVRTLQHPRKWDSPLTYTLFVLHISQLIFQQFLLCFVFTGSHIAHTGLKSFLSKHDFELLILLSQPSECSGTDVNQHIHCYPFWQLQKNEAELSQLIGSQCAFHKSWI